jgi:class 3 adenylate cyclase
MALLNELKGEVKKIFGESWQARDGQVVPDPEDLRLGNDAVEFERATVLYADLSGSTDLVNNEGWAFSAEIYKTFLYCAAKIIRSEGGSITSYDGDRVMGVFVGKNQSVPAVRCGLKINYAVQTVINPALAVQYPDKKYEVSQIVGIDTSAIRAARTGVRGGNDIVWVGRAANFAAKLTELKLPERTWITKDVHGYLTDNEKLGGEHKATMWKAYQWSQNADYPIYGSTWRWEI